MADGKTVVDVAGTRDVTGCGVGTTTTGTVLEATTSVLAGGGIIVFK